jgi:hypothetical protein
LGQDHPVPGQRERFETRRFDVVSNESNTENARRALREQAA